MTRFELRLLPHNIGRNILAVLVAINLGDISRIVGYSCCYELNKAFNSGLKQHSKGRGLLLRLSEPRDRCCLEFVYLIHEFT